jgi:hypothetical protein
MAEQTFEKPSSSTMSIFFGEDIPAHEEQY